MFLNKNVESSLKLHAACLDFVASNQNSPFFAVYVEQNKLQSLALWPCCRHAWQ